MRITDLTIIQKVHSESWEVFPILDSQLSNSVESSSPVLVLVQTHSVIFVNFQFDIR